ncbi:uncharacterized protein C2845_PM13G02520 [Panicum miliaceum]|uniref:Uncharacterized protein n=1 Tax=Panicum miliaceum TaxID=4540 RepID=A0A3L6RJM5_PANMI|nr:uncharacterized protein C2845_PM13G02520 [Panicum miliaceum]
MDPAEVPEGIDPKSACRVEITVNSYFTMWDNRKEYNQGRTVRFIISSEEYSIIDLEKDIVSEFKWGSDQQANFRVLTEGSVTCKLVSDAQFLDLLRASRVVKLLMAVGRREHNVREGEISAAMNIGGGEMPAAMNIGGGEMPAAMNIGGEEMPSVMNNNLEIVGTIH